MKRLEFFIGLLRIPVDALAISAALLLSYRLREYNVDLIPGVQLLDAPSTLPSVFVYLQHFVLPSIAVLLLYNTIARLYSLQLHIRFLKELEKIIIVTALWLVTVMIWYFLIQKELFYSRIVLVHSGIFLAVFVAAGRAAMRILKDAFLRHGYGVIHIASIGSIPLTNHALQVFIQHKRYAYTGHFNTLQALKKQNIHTIDLLIQTDPAPKSTTTLALIDYCRSMHIEYAFLPPVFADVPHRIKVERIQSVLFLRFQPTPLDGWGKVVKRLCDIIGSMILLILLAPVFLIVSIIIAFDSGWPIFYVSVRVGEKGVKTIPVLKFRSMIRNADALKSTLLQKNERKDGPLFKISNDPRVTKIGSILRRFDIDELPQLLNVLLGHMSLVGPRPHLPSEVARYKTYERRVFAVKPGITGLAQISGRSDLSFHDEVQLDLQYIEEWSLKKDIAILLRTIAVVLQKSNG